MTQLETELVAHLSELCRVTNQFLDGQLVTFPLQTLYAAEMMIAYAQKAKGGQP